jgi:argininosuccinate lyase
MTEKLWDGRFAEKTNELVERFTSSINTDKTLYSYDIQGSIAHCKMLAKQSIISNDEAEQIIKGLLEIKEEIESGAFKYDDKLEDIHMHIEARLIEKIGETGKKLHTARSRNDQVALDVRMYLKEKTLFIINEIISLQKSLIRFAKEHKDIIMPGYTHMQRAQPVLLAHHIMAYYEMFERDIQRFEDSLKRTDVMPLGAAALAGTTYPIDRDYVAKLLNFSQVSSNSIDTVSDRDFIIEFLSCASICMIHLSRISEEFILWSGTEFNFIELPDAFTTGSSIMPQKKNPDICELTRGKTGGVFGALICMLTIMKGLPLAYDRDMQEDKKPLFNAVNTLGLCVKIYADMLPKIKVHKDTMKKAASIGFLNATDFADYLTSKGMPFRDAHNCAGKAVSYALKNTKELNELTLKELQSFSSLINKDIFKALGLENMIERRASSGSTSYKNVSYAIEKAEKKYLL